MCNDHDDHEPISTISNEDNTYTFKEADDTGRNIPTMFEPTAANEFYGALSDEQRQYMINEIEKLEERKLEILGIDHKNDTNSNGTPRRIAKMLVNELFASRYAYAPATTAFENNLGYNQLLVTGPIRVRSMCSHHNMPFSGVAFVGVLPKENSHLLGLSKYARIVDYYSRRPQIQEALTSQILDHVVSVTKPAFACVSIVSTHFCMSHRGVGEQNALMTTIKPYVSDGSIKTVKGLIDEFNGHVDRSIALKPLTV